MKIIKVMAILSVCLVCCQSGAQPERERFEREFANRPHPDAHWHPDAGWVVPAIVGGALVYSAINSQPKVVIEQAPVPMTTYPVQINQPQYPPAGYHWEQIIDASCQCARVVLIQNR
jgi:hypothetical protein